MYIDRNVTVTLFNQLLFRDGNVFANRYNDGIDESCFWTRLFILVLLLHGKNNRVNVLCITSPVLFLYSQM